MNAIRRLIVLSLSLIVLAALAAAAPTPQPALAQGCPDAASEPPTLSALNPSSINGAAGATITVSGAHFEAGAVVALEGYGVVTSTCVSSSLLTASIPAGIPGEINGRNYTVKVLTSQGESNGKNLLVMIPAPTEIPGPTATPPPTAFVRPILTVQSYGASTPELDPNEDIDFEMTLVNHGQLAASNVVVTFTAGDIVPRATGGVRALGTINAGEGNRFFQPFTVSGDLSSKIATLSVDVEYTDPFGAAYNETFALTFAARPRVQGGGAAPTATPTPTPAPIERPQLVIQTYGSGDDQLRSGTRFNLSLEVRNLGTVDAEDVTMIVGGGSVADPGSEGTPQPGGVSGGGGEFTTFAPLGASNVQFLGDLAAGRTLSASQPLVVNVSAEAGAYPFKVTFTYVTPDGRRYTDDQVITLLVYGPPQVEISFYRPPDPFFAGQPGPLPIQLINLGTTSAVLGNLEVTAEEAEVSNGTVLVGRLDPGGFFTTDAILIPMEPGEAEVLVTVRYTDDFNQAQTLTETLTVDVMDAPDFGPGGPGGPEDPNFQPPEPQAPEGFFKRLWRAIRGLLGLDSSPRTPDQPGEFFPPEGEFPPGAVEEAIPVRPGP